MPRLSVTAVPAFAACLLAVPSVASAQTWSSRVTEQNEPSAPAVRAAPPPPNNWQSFGMRGIELEIGGGVQSGGGNSPVQAATLFGAAGAGDGFPRGSILDPTTAATLSPNAAFTPYSVDPFAISARVGYRFLHELSVGVFFSFAQYLVNDGADTGDAPDGTSQLQRQQVTVGAYGRYYFTHFHRRLQPWVSLGVGLDYDIAAYTRAVGSTIGGMSGAQPETGNYILKQEGVVVPVAIGLDWRLSPNFAVGPTLGYAHVFPVKGCVEVDVDQYAAPALNGGANTCSSPPVQNFGYDNFYAGIFAKVTFYPITR